MQKGALLIDQDGDAVKAAYPVNNIVGGKYKQNNANNKVGEKTLKSQK